MTHRVSVALAAVVAVTVTLVAAEIKVRVF